MRLTPVAILCALAATATAYPDLSPIRREIRAHMRQFRACYDKALEKDPKLEGKVVATFTIGKTGTVTESKADGLPGVDACVAAVIARLTFPPAPASKGFITISYPFVFAPR